MFMSRGIWMRHRVRQAGKFAKKSYKNDIKQNAKEQDMLFAIIQNQQEQLNLLTEAFANMMEVMEDMRDDLDYMSMTPEDRAQYEFELNQEKASVEEKFEKEKEEAEKLKEILHEYNDFEKENVTKELMSKKDLELKSIKENYVVRDTINFPVNDSTYERYIKWVLRVDVRTKYKGIPTFVDYCNYYGLIKDR